MTKKSTKSAKVKKSKIDAATISKKTRKVKQVVFDDEARR